MKWLLLMVFMFVSGQAFSSTEFEPVHQLAFTNSQIREIMVIMKPMRQKRLVPLYKDIRLLPRIVGPRAMLAARK